MKNFKSRQKDEEAKEKYFMFTKEEMELVYSKK